MQVGRALSLSRARSLSKTQGSASMQLVLVQMHAHCVQIGLATVAPSYVDVIHTVETELCSGMPAKRAL